MGGNRRRTPDHLAKKLIQIRMALGLSQNQLIRELGLDDQIVQATISGFEVGRREPPLHILLLYARLAGVSVDMLIDDELDIPVRLPARKRK